MPALLPDAKLEFTDKWLRALTPPDKQKTYWDVLLPSFGLRVAPGGAKTWIVQRGVEAFDVNSSETVRKLRRFTLGRYPALSLAEARKAAKETVSVRRTHLDGASEGGS